eukprot:scaffold71265_cov50-Attheya_sp.AAC.3
MVFAGGGVRFTKRSYSICAKGEVCDNFKGSTRSISKFAYSAGSGVAGDLDACHDCIADLIQDNVAAFVNTLTVHGPLIVEEDADKATGELNVSRQIAHVFGNGLGCMGDKAWNGGKVNIKREFQLTADGGNAADNVSTINRTGVPSISGSYTGFHEDGRSPTIIRCNSHGAVEKFVKVFDADSFVITTSAYMTAEF